MGGVVCCKSLTVFKWQQRGLQISAEHSKTSIAFILSSQVRECFVSQRFLDGVICFG